MDNGVQIETLQLFPLLDRMLLALLSSLTEEEWNTRTVAKLWNVKDIAAHLLDGTLRALSTSRDGYFGEQPAHINSYQELVAYLNNLNMSWTSATRRLSPEILLSLLEVAFKEYTAHLNSLDPFANAIFPVAWAGQDVSPNWFHIAREYTEKFLHQQQIRDAVGKPGLMTKQLYYPFINTLMFAFPHTFKEVQAPVGTVVSLIVTTEIGGQWNIIKTATEWLFTEDDHRRADAIVKIDPDTAWKLFSKSWTPEAALNNVEIIGDERLARHVLRIVAVMA